MSGQSISDALFEALAKATGNIDKDMPALLQTIGESLGFEVATLWRWSPEQKTLCCAYAWQRQDAAAGEFLEVALGTTLQAGDPVPGAVFVSEEPVWVPDLKEYPSFRRAPAAIAAGLRSGLAFPVRGQNQIVAVFELFTFSSREPDKQLFDNVAKAVARLGDVIERLDLDAQRVKLLVQLEEAQRRQNFLLNANRALSTTRGLAATIDRLATVAVPTIGDLCLIDVARDGGIERLAAHHSDPSIQPTVNELLRFPPNPLGQHPAAVVIRTGQSLLTPQMSGMFLSATTQSTEHLALTKQLSFTSYVSVPLLSRERAIGALTIVSAGSGRHLDEDDLSLARELAAQVASVIEREQRYDEQHEVAHFLQKSMLPERLHVPQGWNIAARYLAGNEATEVGGDFYDVVPLSRSKIALVIGDVAGHDLDAITVMAKVRNALRAFLQTMNEPDEALGALDQFVVNQQEDRFVTVALAVLNLENGAIDLCAAGHPLPLLVNGCAELVDCIPGMPVGLGGPRDEVCHSVIDRGSSLVLYTDGLVERRQGGHEARLPELRKALIDCDQDNLETASDQVLAITLEDSEHTDDVAFLWVKRL